MQEVFDFATEKMEKSIKALHNEFVTMRVGRASPAVLDKIVVDYYGVPTPIQQMAAVSVQEGVNLIIQPWDISTLKPIEIRLAFPPLTEEKRKLLCKDVSKYAEECKVAIRSIRRDAIEKLKKMKKDSVITEDDLHNGEDKIQKITDKFVKEADELASKKEKDIMEI